MAEPSFFSRDGPVRRIHKMVPTDMGWHPTFQGHMAQVRMSVIPRKNDVIDYTVVVSGGDDTTVQWWFTELDHAIACYDAITYIQSTKDIRDRFSLGQLDNNGWPSDRFLFEHEWYDEQQQDEDDEVFITSRRCDPWDPWESARGDT